MNFIVSRYPGLPGKGARTANAGELIGGGGWLGNITNSVAGASSHRTLEKQPINMSANLDAIRIRSPPQRPTKTMLRHQAYRPIAFIGEGCNGSGCHSPLTLRYRASVPWWRGCAS